MDMCEPTPRRHKRTFTEMTHSATLLQSPINFGSPASSNFAQASHLASESLPSFFENRRTSHPHNYHSQRASEEMSERSQSQPRPRLEHQASQTVIDLTDDVEDAPPLPRSNTERRRPQRPPHLGRSDAINLEDLIDLTGDNGDVEVMITGARQVGSRPASLPRPRSSLRLPFPNRLPDRADSPPLFVPVAAAHISRSRPFPRPFDPRGLGFHMAHRGEISGAGFQHAHFPAVLNMMDLDIMNHVHQFAMPQAMPGAMNYQQSAWADRKPEHVPPPPARENFTRSPTENDIVVCPSCEQELVQSKDTEEPVVKKNGKAPTRKEREEHPFWVVKECGHVYCNSCYQLRGAASKHSQISFQEVKSSKKKQLLCAVENCESDVKDKVKWVGIFL